MIERIEKDGEVLAIILRRDFEKPGIEFITPDHYSQQLGYMKREEGYVIQPHVHNLVVREVRYTNEVLLIKSGRVRADFYSDEKEYLESVVLEAGDVVLLAFGGHGFEMLEESEIIEVKQGPYVRTADKLRFDPISPDKIYLRPAEGKNK